MAVQQNKKSHARKCNRRSHDRVATPSVIYCESCGKPTLPHSVCPSCGTYRKHTVASPQGRENPSVLQSGPAGRLSRMQNTER